MGAQLPLAVLAASTALLLVAAISDARILLIPDWIPLAIIGVFVVEATLLSGGYTMSGRLVSGGTGLVLMLALYALGQCGGGDVKLVPAVLLMVPGGLLVQFLVFVVLAAVAVAALQACIRALRADNGQPAEWILLRHGVGIPLAVVLAIAYTATLLSQCTHLLS